MHPQPQVISLVWSIRVRRVTESESEYSYCSDSYSGSVLLRSGVIQSALSGKLHTEQQNTLACQEPAHQKSD